MSNNQAFMDNEKSFLVARRLKSERNRAKLSHAKLSEAIQEKYGISISVDSLKGYEVDTENKAKTGSNKGMRIEYLYCLADFYGVSTDYLLGISNSRSRNTEIRTISNATGLSDKSILKLTLDKEFIDKGIYDPDDFSYISVLNRIIESESFADMSKLADAYCRLTADSSLHIDLDHLVPGLDDASIQTAVFLKALLTEYFFKTIENK